MRTAEFIKDLFRRFPGLMATNIALLSVSGLIEVLTLLSLAPVVDLLLNSTAEQSSQITRAFVPVLQVIGLQVTLWTMLSMFALLHLIRSGLLTLVKYSLLKTKYAFQRDLLSSTLDTFFQAKWYFFSSGRQGVLLNTMTREAAMVGDAFGSVATSCANFLELCLYLVVPFYISWQVTGLTLVMASAFALFFLPLGQITYKLGIVATATSNEIMSVIQESLASAKILLGFGNQRKPVEGFCMAYDTHARVAINAQALTFATGQLYFPLALMLLIVALGVAQRLSVPISETSILLYSLLKAIPIVGSLPQVRTALRNAIPSYEQFQTLNQRAKELRQPSGTISFSGIRKEIVTEYLGFSYPGCEPTLVDINVRIPKGKMVAFVGESGAGKSTLVDIFMGFHEPTSGAVMVDGIDLKELDMTTYRNRIGYVPQDDILFNSTVAENMRWAAPECTIEEIKTACKKANADLFIEQLKDGYETVVGDRGVRLSGGQVQRVALARAILRNPVLLILDEATSSLDSESERLIQKAIESIAKDTTVVVVAHRLATIANADYIYVMDHGRIVEEGSWLELLRVGGSFSRMVELQKLEVAN